MIPFTKVYANGEPTQARVGDRFIYDQRNGTLHVFRQDAIIEFEVTAGAGRASRCFVGREWSQDLTRSCAELYARMSGLKGEVVLIDGSFSTLSVFEVAA